MGAKNYLFLREVEWQLELHLPTAAPTVLFYSKYRDVERGGPEVVVLFGKYELESAGLCGLSLFNPQSMP